MLTLFRNGGVPMWFILLFGLVALGGAAFFAARAERKLLGFIKWMSLATVFSVLSGTAADLGTTCFTVSHAITGQWPNGTPFKYDGPWSAMLLEGIAESMSPMIMGMSLLALTALLTAIGSRRADAKS
jgi:hypothetical protein